MRNNNEIYKELDKSLSKNPDFSIPDVSDYVLNKTYPRRIYYDRYSQSIEENWRLTDSDVLKALKLYNKQ